MSYPFGSSRQYASARGFSPSKLGQRDDDEKAKDCLKTLLVLAEQRLFWEPQIDNIIAYVNHGRRFITDRDRWPGEQTGQEIYDDTAMLARNKLRDGMVGYLCSRNQPWFALELPGKFNFPPSSGMRSWSGRRVDEYPQVQRWLQDCQTVMYSALNRSNFYDVVGEFISDGATCGTAHILAEEDIETASIVFTVPHFRECYIAENQWKKVDTCYRVYRMTLRQLEQKFGWDKMVSIEPNFERDYESNMHGERDVLHATYPRQDYEPRRIDAKGKRWVSEWVYCRGGKIIVPGSGSTSPALAEQKNIIAKEGGYDSMPSISWRWRVNDDEVYGRGPAHDAFVSIAQLNQMGRTNLVTAHRAAEPPLVAYSDLRTLIQRGPNGITYMESNRGDLRTRMPQPLFTGVQQLPFELQYSDRVRAIVNEHFHTDVFMLMSQLANAGHTERMVVEQVMELQGEKAAILGTRVGNLQSEAFDPLINRIYSIEAEAGRIPEPPDILLETVHGPVEVQYLGPLAQAQTRLTTVRSMQSFLALTKQLAEMDPTIIHFINSRYALRNFRDAVNAPVDMVYDEKTCNQILQQLNQMAEQQRQVENAPKLAKAAAAMGKAPEAGSALKQLVSGGASTTESVD
jgi:hypothetical protein